MALQHCTAPPPPCPAFPLQCHLPTQARSCYLFLHPTALLTCKASRTSLKHTQCNDTDNVCRVSSHLHLQHIFAGCKATRRKHHRTRQHSTTSCVTAQHFSMVLPFPAFPLLCHMYTHLQHLLAGCKSASRQHHSVNNKHRW